MNKILLILAAGCAGAAGFGAFHRAAEQTGTAATLREADWKAGRNRFVETQETVTVLRAEVLEKKNRLRQTLRHPEISPEMLLLLEGDTSNGHAAAWAELRQQLGIGWDSSAEYVLASKRVIKELDFPRLLSAARVTDTASEILALTPGEKSALRSVLEQVRQGQWLRVERREPGGDIVAQYTVPLPDPAFEQSMSNNFAAGIVAAVGSERAELLATGAWREFKAGLAPAEPETMTIRRAVVEGEPDLVCEMTRGSNVSTDPVRYAHYPSSWFLTVFPGGWKTLAQREGFDLPRRFQY